MCAKVRMCELPVADAALFSANVFRNFGYAQARLE
jgi:hypothetical protein